MAEFILKDWYGKEKSFDRDTVYFQDAEGNLLPFTHGTGNPTLEDLEVTENGNYTPSDGVDGFGSVSVNVPDPEIKLQDKTITENGTYSADSGYDGLGNVTVEVAGSGGGTLPAGVYWGGVPIRNTAQPNYAQRYEVYNGELLAFVGTSGTGSTGRYIYKYNGTSFTLAYDHGSTTIALDFSQSYAIEYNGKLHRSKHAAAASHFVWDGTALTQLNNFPDNPYYYSMFVQNGKLKMFGNSTQKVYVWDEATDTWTAESGTLSELAWISGGFFTVGGVVYAINGTKVYKYENASLSLLFTIGTTFYGNNPAVIHDDKLYYKSGYALYCLDFGAGTFIQVGYCYGTWLFVYNNAIHTMVINNPSYGSLTMYEVTE